MGLYDGLHGFPGALGRFPDQVELEATVVIRATNSLAWLGGVAEQAQRPAQLIVWGPKSGRTIY